MSYIVTDNDIVYVKDTFKSGNKIEFLDAKVNYSSYHRDSLIEIDAEGFSREFSPVMVLMYLEKTNNENF